MRLVQCIARARMALLLFAGVGVASCHDDPSHPDLRTAGGDKTAVSALVSPGVTVTPLQGLGNPGTTYGNAINDAGLIVGYSEKCSPINCNAADRSRRNVVK